MSTVDDERESELRHRLLALATALRLSLPASEDPAWEDAWKLWSIFTQDLRTRRKDALLRVYLRWLWLTEAEGVTGTFPPAWNVLTFNPFKPSNAAKMLKLEEETIGEVWPDWMNGFIVAFQHTSDLAVRRLLVSATVAMPQATAQTVVAFYELLADGDYTEALRRGRRATEFDLMLKTLEGPLSLALITRMVMGYASNARADLLVTWADKIALDVRRQGDRLAWENLAEETPGVEYEQVWLTKEDGNVRPHHVAMQGVAVRVGTPWIVPTIGPQNVPGEDEEGCRCRAGLRPITQGV